MKDIESILDWKNNDYHPVVELPDSYDVLDLSVNPWVPSKTEFSIGRYDEVRPGMYTTPIFEGIRNIHVGIDINGPIGTPCMAFTDGKITHFGYNPEPGDYGYVVITAHKISGINIWALYGHLSSESIVDKSIGQKIQRGETIAWFGPEAENGGWEPHLHFQLSLIEPETHDLPGVVSSEDRLQALQSYPDPRLILGPLY
ncbi:MAG: peptidoglycan DD-metalloendopeptidase family protein [Candidatus Poseidoniia archaeon]|nr:peptidoglycan DD-metalloendopeptidase family protein [Candidatus Poseidoniia archaeon]